MRQLICEKIKLLWLLPVVLLPFAEIHHSQSETTNQSQEECLSSVNHARVHADHTPLLHSAYRRSNQTQDCRCAAAVLMAEKQPINCQFVEWHLLIKQR